MQNHVSMDLQSVTKLSVWVSHKKRHISVKNQYFLKIQPPTKPRDCRGYVVDLIFSIQWFSKEIHVTFLWDAVQIIVLLPGPCWYWCCLAGLLTVLSSYNFLCLLPICQHVQSYTEHTYVYNVMWINMTLQNMLYPKRYACNYNLKWVNAKIGIFCIEHFFPYCHKNLLSCEKMPILFTFGLFPDIGWIKSIFFSIIWIFIKQSKHVSMNMISFMNIYSIKLFHKQCHIYSFCIIDTEKVVSACHAGPDTAW